MNIDVVTMQNEKVGTAELPDEIFNIEWNEPLVHQVVVAQAANARDPIAHTKGRGDVRGGGKKPWRQKGTGRARHGSIRSPIWSGGGVTHGPSKDRKFGQKINKKMFRRALYTILSQKVRDREFTVVDILELSEPKTKKLAETLKVFFGDERQSALLVPKEARANIFRASRNIQHVKSISPRNLNALDILAHRRMLVDRGALDTIASHYSGTQRENDDSEK